MFPKAAISALLVLAALPLAARTRPHYGETLRVEIAGDPWQRPNGIARRLVLDGLTQIGDDGDIRPALATSWTSENADHRWQFRLRPGVHFHDGSALASTTIAASLMASCMASCPWQAVRALGTSIVFTSDTPMPHLPQLLAGDEFLVSKPQTAESDGGTGPFQVSGFTNGILTLAASDSYWEGRPFVDAIEIHTRRPTSDQWLDLSGGRADLVEVPAENIRQAQQQHFNVLASAPVEVLALELSNTGALANPNLRAAMAYAVDRNALANVIFQKQGKASAALLPQNISGFAFLFPAERDLNKAHELRGGITAPLLTLQADSSGTFQLAAQRIALNLREAGFNVQVVGPGTKTPDMRLRIFRVGGADAAADLSQIAFATGQPIQAGGADLSAAYGAERELLDRKTLIPLVHLPCAYALSSRVRDLQLHYDGTLALDGASVEAAK
ncbi:ABC transporter substrate-binding protein [Occallatibacter riparius]|uniref:ABC transporter substrate-binding protein n=1 Tax=Occallatibacter riparius TaxID=1002689 RepID=A0A9J7BSE5_9BACT|nr:ABC transporter substrate-binding protein [Occallatibacter riparius]UWZ85584.1 ABC transporter substrate-binding protein [Occallatibacter riparius]